MHGGNVWQGRAPEDWLDFSANLRPEGPPEWVRQALSGALEAAAYYPDPDMARARAGLAAYLDVPPECVLPTAGGIAAIDLVNRLEIPNTIVSAPGFGEYEETALAGGKSIRRIPLDLHSGLSPAETLRRSLAPTSVVWLCNPHNPTGLVSTPGEILKLLEAVEAAGSFLAVDEAFIDYCPTLSVRGVACESNRLIVVGSLTKTLCVPGVRLGYVCAAPKMIEKISKRLLPWSLNCFATALAAALPAHRAEVSEDVERNRTRRAWLGDALTSLGAVVYPSEAPFLLARFDRPVAPMATWLKQQGILVRECLDFAGIDDGFHLRLAVKTEAANARLIKALREAMACAENL